MLYVQLLYTSISFISLLTLTQNLLCAGNRMSSESIAGSEVQSFASYASMLFVQVVVYFFFFTVEIDLISACVQAEVLEYQ
jgi:hypothetical protein